MHAIQCVNCNQVVMKKTNAMKFCSERCAGAYHWRRREEKREPAKPRIRKTYSETHFDWRDFPEGVIA